MLEQVMPPASGSTSSRNRVTPASRPPRIELDGDGASDGCELPEEDDMPEEGRVRSCMRRKEPEAEPEAGGAGELRPFGEQYPPAV